MANQIRVSSASLRRAICAVIAALLIFFANVAFKWYWLEYNQFNEN